MSWREILLALGGKERKGGENEMPWFVRVNMNVNGDVVGCGGWSFVIFLVCGGMKLGYQKWRIAQWKRGFTGGN